MIHSISYEKTINDYFNNAQLFLNPCEKTLLKQRSTLIPSPTVKSKLDENHLKGVSEHNLL